MSIKLYDLTPIMSHSILITGGSGYLGGSLVAQLSRTQLPPHQNVYALVRAKQQAEAIKKYGAEPLIFDLEDEDAVVKNIVDAKISIIYFLIDALKSTFQLPMIRALGEVKKQTGRDVHFLHTSGAKIFSEHAGLPTDRAIADTDPRLFEIQKTSKAPHDIMNVVCPRSVLLCSCPVCCAVETKRFALNFLNASHTYVISGHSNEQHCHRDGRVSWSSKLHLRTLYRLRRGRGIR
jgi:hypothetical protein